MSTDSVKQTAPAGLPGWKPSAAPAGSSGQFGVGSVQVHRTRRGGKGKEISQKTSIAGTPFPNWALVVAVLIGLFLIYELIA